MSAGEQVRSYAAAGWKAIKLGRDKKPITPAWQKAEIPLEDLVRHAEGGGNIGLQMGEVSGGLCAVDLDCDEARALAPRILPKTLTASKGDEKPSHYLYRSPGADYFKIADVDGSEILSFKASAKGKGHQIVVAPSTHASKGPYTWTGGFDPARVVAVPPDEGTLRIRRLGAGALIARHVPPGGRHDFMLALAGYLLRNGEPEAVVQSILTHAWDVAGALSVEAQRDIEAGVPETAEKLRVGTEPVKGGRTLNETVEGLARALAKALGWQTRGDEDEGATDEGGGGKPDQTELSGRWIASHPLIRFGAGEWRRYGDGVWEKVHEDEVKRGVLAVLEAARGEGVKPTAGLVESITALVRLKVRVPDQKWEADTNILVCANGTLELSTRTLRAHSPEDYALRAVSFDYDPDAKAPIWENRLGARLGDIWDFLQEYAGYCLTTRTDLETAVWLHGPPGCGKSTFIEGLLNVLGDRAGSLGLADIERSHFALANIRGKTLLTATEQPSAFLKSTDTIDKLISGEPVEVERKYKDPEEIRPVAKILWAMNETPQIRNPNAGLFRRVQVVPWPALPEGERNPLIKAAIMEHEGPGILNWALDGLDRLNALGTFTIPMDVENATQEFKAENDLPAMFVDECCKTGEDRSESSKELYKMYRQWCKDSGYNAMGKTRAFAELERLGFRRQRDKSGYRFHGLELVEYADTTSSGW